MALTSSQRRDLRARAHHLNTVVQTGAKGLTESVIAEIDQALEHHELMKVKLAGADRDDRKDMATELAAQVKAEIVGSIGAVVILYRENPDK